MPHTCDDCGETFETLSRLRLHDCPDDREAIERERRKRDEDLNARIRKMEHEETSAVKRRASGELLDALDRAIDGEVPAVHRALAQYERDLSEEWAAAEDGEYWGFHRVFFGPAVDGLETAVETEGWPFLLNVLEAYWPETTYDFGTYSDHEPYGGEVTGEYGEFPHVSHVLVTVTGRRLVRTRRADGVEAVPVEALEYLCPFHRHPGDTQPWIDSMSYGWGIGHPEHPLEERIETIVDGEYDIWAGTAVEHAFHADQHAAATLVESLFEAGVVSDPAMILNGLGGIERGYYPDASDHFQWEELYPEFDADGFDWDPEVRDRLRSVVEDCGLARQLPADWSFADIVL